MKQFFFKFQPLPQERVWGGRTLEQMMGRSLPPMRPVGESWEIVDRADVQSVVRCGPLEGRTLRQLIESRSEEIMGPVWAPGQAFPILVKWLDCRERLSLQIHPPAKIAAQLGGEPKTENWYVVQAEPDAAVLVGLKSGIDEAEFEAAIENGSVEKCVQRLPTRAGDSLLVHSGVMHAIDGGNLILEIQQNSDTTYRVHDWGRQGLDGKPRTLHVRESLLSLKANSATPSPLVRGSGDVTILAECEEFRITERRLNKGSSLELKAGEQPRIVSVISGALDHQQGALSAGDNVLVPYAAGPQWIAREQSVVLITENFLNASAY